MAQVEELDDADILADEVNKPRSQTSIREQVVTEKVDDEGEEGKEQDDNGDEEEEEEEYEIEAILDYKRSYFKKGENAYLVKWKGYSEEHNSWVAEDDAENARELITEFLKKRAKNKEQSAKQAIRGRKPNSAKISKSGRDGTPDTESVSVSTTKRGRGKAASPSDSEEEEQRTAKKSHVNVNINASASAKHGALAALDKTDDEDFAMVDASGMIHDGRVYTSMKALKLAARRSWEELVKRVLTVECSGKDLMVYFETTDGHYVRESSSTCKDKLPRKLFDFYESHLRWKVTEEDASD